MKLKKILLFLHGHKPTRTLISKAMIKLLHYGYRSISKLKFRSSDPSLRKSKSKFRSLFLELVISYKEQFFWSQIASQPHYTNSGRNKQIWPDQSCSLGVIQIIHDTFLYLSAPPPHVTYVLRF